MYIVSLKALHESNFCSPMLDMTYDYSFNYDMMNSLLGGGSTLAIPRLNINTLAEANAFFRSYGYDTEESDSAKQLWNYHSRAVTYLKTELLTEDENIPIDLTDPSRLKELGFLLIYASTRGEQRSPLQIWSCSILRVMHVLVHLDNDLFSQFSHQIQDQILKPIQAEINEDPITGIYLGNPSDLDSIALKKFVTKSFKTSDSTVTKLLARPEKVAFAVLDKIGVRIVTKHLFDVFSVMRYLTEKNIISFPHHIPDQSNNTLYPINLFFEVVENMVKEREISSEEMDKLLQQKLVEASEKAEFNEKENVFSGANYKFIKFISRKLVRVPTSEGERPLSFFYPYEVQIVDYETYLANLAGPSSHDEYKVRQKKEARARVLGVHADEQVG